MILTIFLPAGFSATLFAFILAATGFFLTLTVGFRAEAAFFERNLPFTARFDLSLLAALFLLFTFLFIVVLLAPPVASSYVPSLTLTLLILPQPSSVL